MPLDYPEIGAYSSPSSPSAGSLAGGFALTGLTKLLGGLAGSPLLIPLLTSFGPAIWSKLFGGNPQEKYRQQVAALYSPSHVANLTDQFYNTALNSPGFSQGMSNIAAGANQTAGNLAASLGARGIGTTGTGAILSSLTPSIVGSQQAALRSKAYESSQAQAMEQIKQQLAALTGTQGPSQTQQYLGAGISAFSPYLQGYLSKKYPDVFGNIGGVQHGKEGTGQS